VLVLRYYEDLPDATIAELMACTPGTVRSQAARGLAALRSQLDQGLAEAVGGGVTRHDR
jgi:DNA-directed RNA polymerase specialized sigma24 family protein